MNLRLRHFRKTGDLAGCRATAEMWEKLNRTDAGSLYAAARYRAVTAAVQTKNPAADAARLAIHFDAVISAGEIFTFTS